MTELFITLIALCASFCGGSLNKCWSKEQGRPGTVHMVPFVSRCPDRKGFLPLGSALVYLLWFLDVLGFKSIASRGFARHARPDHHPYVVYMAAKQLIRSGNKDEARELLTGALEKRPSLRCGRLLIHLFIKDKQHQSALNVAQSLSDIEPENPWPYLLIGDVQYFFLRDSDSAFESFKKALDICKRLNRKNPLKVAYKRVSRVLEEKGMEDELVDCLAEFIKLESSNFHDHEFDILVRGMIDRGRRDEARGILSLGIRAYPRSLLLRQAWESLGFGKQEDLPAIPVRGKTPPPDVELIPVKTRLFVENDDPVQAMKQYVTQPLPGDIAILSSCVAGLMEGRIFMEGAVEPGLLAKTLSRFVDQKDIPFGGAAPMANPLSMQVLLEEIGTLKTLLAAGAGAVGKLLGKKGWFYIVGGQDAGQIDDVLGSLPPYDYYVIMGPEDPSGLSSKMARELGCEAAIVDANDLGVAWAVGYSSGVDPAWLEEVMSSNPAGNQEQQTPVVLVRRKPSTDTV
jgi:tetratricopeptide (TPR) repeat protein